MQNMTSGKSTFGLDANVVALLCYVGNVCCALGLIISIITVIQDKTNKLARFHAFQSILLSGLGILFGIGINIINGVAMASRSNALAMVAGLIGFVIGIALFIAVIYTAIQAYQGKLFKLPIIGDMADKWSS